MLKKNFHQVVFKLFCCSMQVYNLKVNNICQHYWVNIDLNVIVLFIVGLLKKKFSTNKITLE